MAKVDIRPPFVRSPYNYDTAAASDESALRCDDPSLAQQHYKDECDINTIVERFTRTGVLPQAGSEPFFGDFIGLPNNYHDALNQVRSQDGLFMQLPADVRAKFRNDVGQLLDFINDDSNYDEAVKLGLIPAKTLSPAGARDSNAQAQPAGGKVKEKPKGLLRSIPGLPEGYKLVPDVSPEGDGGEE